MLQTGKWSRSSSDGTLLFFDDDRTVKRDGSNSCFPCAKADFVLRGPGERFCVTLKLLVGHCNSLTVGLAAGGGETFPLSSSDGVGDEPGTAGLHIANMAEFAETGDTASFMLRETRKRSEQFKSLLPSPVVKEGDILEFALTETLEALKLEILVNGRLACTMPLPASFHPPFRPLTTLSDDCELTIAH